MRSSGQPLTRQANMPSVAWVPPETTRRIALYVPGGSGFNDACGKVVSLALTAASRRVPV
jgi:hypothetical protein